MAMSVPLLSSGLSCSCSSAAAGATAGAVARAAARFGAAARGAGAPVSSDSARDTDGVTVATAASSVKYGAVITPSANAATKPTIVATPLPNVIAHLQWLSSLCISSARVVTTQECRQLDNGPSGLI